MNTTCTIAVIVISLLTASLASAQEQQAPTRTIITPKSYNVSISNLGSRVNSADEDFAPLILGNGRTIYFTTTRDGDQNIYSCVSTPTDWSEPANIGSMLNTAGDEGGTSITPDGHWMILTACDRTDGYGDCDLYIAEYTGGSWRNVKNLGPTVNSPEWDSQPAISMDGLTLIFSSERPGGYGGTDLWMTTRHYGGDWSTPVNLGPVINSTRDEMSPFFAADNKTLYFASDGLPGIGGFDIYKTKRTPSGWTTAEDVGTPINSEYDDYFYTLQLGTDNVFFASNRPNGFGELDLYVGVPNPLPPDAVTVVIGTVQDTRTKIPVGASLTVRDISTNQVVSTFSSDDMDGNYVVVLQSGKKYVITAEAPGYLFYSDRFDIPIDAKNNTIRKDILMTRDIVRLLVYFDFDKATLQPESYVDLDRAVDWLRANTEVSVELAGHTDNVGSREYNKRLSDDRAKSVMSYLVSKGVSPSRLMAKGYGMDSPIATNDTDEGRATNRRVEFRVKSR